MPRRDGPPGPRRSLGFSLDEAVRIRAALVAGRRAPPCPRCTGALSALADGGGDGAWFVICDRCRASVVVRPADASARSSVSQ